MLKPFIVCCAVLAASPALATTLDFEDLAPGPTGNVIVQGEYRFTAFDDSFVVTSSGSNAIFPPNPFDFSRPATITLSRADGAAFDLISLDIFAGDSNGLGVPLGFKGTLQNGSNVFHTVDLPEYGNAAIPDTRTLVSLPDTFRNVIAVSWENGAEFHQFDNVVVTNAISAVPEPTSWAMMIGGFALSGAGFRRCARKDRPLAA